MSKPATPLSIHLQLIQSLHSNDTKLLEQCLHNIDTITIDATVAALSAVHIIPLLTAIQKRMEASHQRALPLLKWIRAIITHHTGYLASTKELQQKIQELQETLQKRAKPMNALEKLRGRLELVMGQGALRQKVVERQKAAALENMVDIDDIETEDESDGDMDEDENSNEGSDSEEDEEEQASGSRHQNEDTEMNGYISTELVEH